MKTQDENYQEFEDYVILKQGEIPLFENVVSHATLKLFEDVEKKKYLASVNICFLKIKEREEAICCIKQILSLNYPTQRGYDLYFFTRS